MQVEAFMLDADTHLPNAILVPHDQNVGRAKVRQLRTRGSIALMTSSTTAQVYDTKATSTIFPLAQCKYDKLSVPCPSHGTVNVELVCGTTTAC